MKTFVLNKLNTGTFKINYHEHETVKSQSIWKTEMLWLYYDEFNYCKTNYYCICFKDTGVPAKKKGDTVNGSATRPMYPPKKQT